MSRKQQDEVEEVIMYILKDISKNRVWHEQFYSWKAAEECIQSYKDRGIEGGWKIEAVYPKNKN